MECLTHPGNTLTPLIQTGGNKKVRGFYHRSFQWSKTPETLDFLNKTEYLYSGVKDGY